MLTEQARGAYARYIGRVGALAVALGVGAAVATGVGAGIATAQEGTGATENNPPSDTQSGSETTTSAISGIENTGPADPVGNDGSGEQNPSGNDGDDDDESGNDDDIPASLDPDVFESASSPVGADGGRHQTPPNNEPPGSNYTTATAPAVTGFGSQREGSSEEQGTDGFGFVALTSDDLAPTAATTQTLTDWGLPLPQYPDVPGFTKTEVAAIAFIVLAQTTITTLPTNPLSAIPLALMTLTAFGRLVQLGANAAPTASYTQTSQLLGVVNGQVVGDDPEGDVLTYTVAHQGEKGFAFIDPKTGEYTYTAYTLGVTPVEDTFYVRVDDNMGIRGFTTGMFANSTLVPITVTIPGITVNEHPVFDVEPTITDVNAETGVMTGIFKAHNPEGADLSYRGHALLGSVDIAETANDDGTVTFTYAPYDPHAAALVDATIGITDLIVITATDADGIPWASSVPVTLATTVNVVPTATYENESPSGALGVVIGRVIVTDPDDTVHTFGPILISTGRGGVVVNPVTGEYAYTPTLDAREAASQPSATEADKFDTFVITVDDLHGGTVDVQVTVPIATVNLAPFGGLPSNVLGDDDGVVRGHIVGVIDADGDPLTYSLPGGVSTAYTDGGGIAHVDAAGNYTYIPRINTVPVFGDAPYLDSFDVVAADGQGGTTTVTVAVLTSLTAGTSTTHPQAGVVDGRVSFDEPDNAALFEFGLGTPPAAGEVTVHPDGTFHYVNTSAVPGDSYTFSIVGTAFGLDVTVVTVTVTPVAPNRAPTADAVGAGLGDSIGVVKGNVHASDEDGDTLAYSVTGYGGAASTVLSNGAVVQVDANGNWAYIPPTSGGIAGVIIDSFTVYVTDGRGGQASTLVGVTTKPLDIDYTSNVDGGTVTGKLNIPDADAHLFTFKKGVGGAKGTWTVEPDGSYTYTTSLTGHGTSPDDSFTVVATTADGIEVTVATVVVTPQLPNTPPSSTATVTDLEFSYLEPLGNTSAGTQTVTGRIVVTDADGDPVTFSAGLLGAFTGSHGGGTVHEDGTFTYTTLPGRTHDAAAGGATSDTFTVTVSDGYGDPVEVTVTVPINPRNAGVTHVNTTGGSTRSVGGKTGGWVTTVSDIDLDTVTATVSPTSKGTVTVTRVGYTFTITYESTSSRSGAFYPLETFTITFSDAHGSTLERSYTF